MQIAIFMTNKSLSKNKFNFEKNLSIEVVFALNLHFLKIQWKIGFGYEFSRHLESLLVSSFVRAMDLWIISVNLTRILAFIVNTCDIFIGPKTTNQILYPIKYIWF